MGGREIVGLGMGFFPHLFFNFLFSFFGTETGVAGENCTVLQTVAGFIQQGPGQQQLFLSQRNVGTTGASFVLQAEPCEGHLEVSLRLKRARDQGEGVSDSVPPSPTLADRKGPGAPQGLVEKSGHTPNPSSTPHELEKHLVFCIRSVNIYWVRRCAKTVVPSRRSCSLAK